ncbi:MAG: inositol monophosphatase family protein, partial [Rhodothermales bacterium]|nr:inositol monophosphatase family protein [Rhodothermales bacterium]
MPTPDRALLERARDAAVDAAQHAARLIRRHAGHIDEAEVAEKATHDLVTDVDTQAQERIRTVLHHAFPGFAFLAEEGPDTGAEATADGYRWIVDPIDGTTNFTRGVPPYAVSIALQREAELVVGVVLEVARGELFTAIQGAGAFGDGRRLHVSRRATLETSLLTTGFPYRAFDHIDDYLTVFRDFMRRSRGVRRPGAASVDFAYVAAGRFDGFFETGLRAWDVAAGAVLVT